MSHVSDITSFVAMEKVELSRVYSAEPNIKLWGQPIHASILSTQILTEEQLVLRIDNNPFRLSPSLNELAEPFFCYLQQQDTNRTLFDSVTARLCAYTHSTSGNTRLVLDIQPAQYMQYLVTGWAASQGLGIKYSSEQIVSFRDLVEPGPALRPLSESVASNHIGINCLLMCQGHLLMTRRSNQVTTDNGMLDVSVSGALEFRGNDTSLFEQALVEIYEELGLERVNSNDLRLIGICREHHRAGKPEVFFLVNLEGSLEQLRAELLKTLAQDAWESSKRIWVDLQGDKLRNLVNSSLIQPSAKIGVWCLCKHLDDGRICI